VVWELQWLFPFSQEEYSAAVKKLLAESNLIETLVLL
jgi:hypothetical protein